MVATARLGLIGLVLGCGGGAERGEAARAAVEQAFAARNVSGPVGVEALGKGVWWRAPALDADCLRDKGLAFRNAKAGEQLSPTYAEQKVFQAATDEGFCVWLGDDLTMTTGDVSQFDGAWVVDTAFSIGRPNPWWDCVDPVEKARPVRVLEGADGTLTIEAEPALFGGSCPHPLPLANPTRKASPAPRAAPPSSPSAEDVQAAAKRLDDALWAGDVAAALDAMACYNLYEESKFGSCSAAELVNVGPIARGELRRRDGPPWSMNVFDRIDEIGRPKSDGDDPTLFHSVVRSASLKRPKRTVSFQWVDGAWKIVGVVQRRAEGLTSAEFVTDLGRSDQRDILRRRMAGEDIDHRGLAPIKPEGEE